MKRQPILQVRKQVQEGPSFSCSVVSDSATLLAVAPQAVHKISQARILEWVAISSSGRGQGVFPHPVIKPASQASALGPRMDPRLDPRLDPWERVLRWWPASIATH